MTPVEALRRPRHNSPVDDETVDVTQWLDGMAAVLRGAREAAVPCGGCTACCEASQFVPIEPDEFRTLAAVPKALRFPAPGKPRGHVVLGYDREGRCPMLGPEGCTIYDARPRACRAYDCRIFAAAGVKPAVRAPAWRFTGDASLLDELRAAVPVDGMPNDRAAAAVVTVSQRRGRFAAP